MKWIFSSREYKAFKQKHFEFVLEQFHLFIILLKLFSRPYSSWIMIQNGSMELFCIFKSTTQLCEVFWQDFCKSEAHKFFQVPFSSVRNPNYTVGIFWYQSVSGCGDFPLLNLGIFYKNPNPATKCLKVVFCLKTNCFLKSKLQKEELTNLSFALFFVC